jgi:hypothetical protein
MTDQSTGVTPGSGAGGQQQQVSQPPAQPAGQQPVQGGAAQQQPGTPQVQQPAQQVPQGGGEAVTKVQVPLSVLQSVEGKLKESRSEADTLRQQINNITALNQQPQHHQQQAFNPFAPQQPPAQQHQQPAQQQVQPNTTDIPDNAFEGYDEQDIPNVKDLKNILKRAIVGAGGGGNAEAVRQALAPVLARLETVQTQLNFPDFQNTIQTYLPDMLKLNPGIAEFIKAAPNKAMAALTFARMNPKYIQAQQSGGGTPAAEGVQTQGQQAQQMPDDPVATLRQIIENSTKPANPGSMGGGQGALQGNDRWKAMSDADFDAEVQRVLQHGGV